MDVYFILRDLGIISLIGFIVSSVGRYLLKRYAPHIFGWLRDDPRPESDEPNTSDAAIWFYELRDERVGPVTGRELRQLRDDGRLSASSLVWHAGMAAWAALTGVEHELAAKPVTSDPAIWHYELDGQRMGPVTGRELRQMLDDGRLRTSTLVWHEGKSHWIALRAVQDEIPAGEPAKIGLPPRPAFLNLKTVSIAVYVLVFIIGITASQHRW
jgi:hypothetical protein